MITATRIPDHIRKAVYDAYNGFCACPGCYNKAAEIHHIVSNSKANAKKWPLFINSPINLKPICHACHNSKAIYGWKITDRQAGMYEEYLENLTTPGGGS